MSKIYPPRVCPECGTEFIPTVKTQIFDRHYCRTKYNRRQHKSPELALGVANIYEQLEAEDRVIAYEIEQLAKLAGNRLTEQILLVVYRAMKRAEKRGADDVKKLLERPARRGRPPKQRD